jgi:hypothetical protein
MLPLLLVAQQARRGCGEWQLSSSPKGYTEKLTASLQILTNQEFPP